MPKLRILTLSDGRRPVAAVRNPGNEGQLTAKRSFIVLNCFTEEFENRLQRYGWQDSLFGRPCAATQAISDSRKMRGICV